MGSSSQLPPRPGQHPRQGLPLASAPRHRRHGRGSRPTCTRPRSSWTTRRCWMLSGEARGHDSSRSQKGSREQRSVDPTKTDFFFFASRYLYKTRQAVGLLSNILCRYHIVLHVHPLRRPPKQRKQNRQTNVMCLLQPNASSLAPIQPFITTSTAPPRHLHCSSSNSPLTPSSNLHPPHHRHHQLQSSKWPSLSSPSWPAGTLPRPGSAA